METKLNIRCSNEFKKKTNAQSEKRGFASVTEYVRQLIIKDRD